MKKILILFLILFLFYMGLVIVKCVSGDSLCKRIPVVRYTPRGFWQ